MTVPSAFHIPRIRLVVVTGGGGSGGSRRVQGGPKVPKEGVVVGVGLGGISLLHPVTVVEVAPVVLGASDTGGALARVAIGAIQNKHPVAQSNRPNCKQRERDRVSVHTQSTQHHTAQHHNSIKPQCNTLLHHLQKPRDKNIMRKNCNVIQFS